MPVLIATPFEREKSFRIPKRREASIEASVVRYAKSKGAQVRKLQAVGNRGWPDRSFFLPGRVVFFIEFKRPTGRLSATQKVEIKMLKDLGFPVFVVFDVETGKKVVDRYVRKATVRKSQSQLKRSVGATSR